jgi:tetratricopeptide (TPR) repeat protein
MTNQVNRRGKPLSDLCRAWQEVTSQAKARWVHVNGLSLTESRELLESFYGKLVGQDHSGSWPSRPPISPVDRTPRISDAGPLTWYWWAIPGIFRSSEAPNSWWPASSLPYALAAGAESLAPIALTRIKSKVLDASSTSLVENCLASIESPGQRAAFLRSLPSTNALFLTACSEQWIGDDGDHQLAFQTRCSAFLCALLARCGDASPIPTVIVIDGIEAADRLILEFLEHALTEAIGLGWPLLVISAGNKAWHLPEAVNRPNRASESPGDLVNTMSHRFPLFRSEHFVLLEPRSGPSKPPCCSFPARSTSLIDSIRKPNRVRGDALGRWSKNRWGVGNKRPIRQLGRAELDEDSAEGLLEIEYNRWLSAATWAKNEREWLGAIRELSLRRQVDGLSGEVLKPNFDPSSSTEAPSTLLDYLAALHLGNNDQAAAHLAGLLVNQGSINPAWSRIDRARLSIIYAHSLAKLGKLTDASTHFAQAIELLTEETSTDHLVTLVRTLEALGTVQLEQGEPAHALDCAQSAEALWQDLLMAWGCSKARLEIGISLKQLTATALLQLSESAKAGAALNAAEDDFRALEAITGPTRALIDLQVRHLRLKIAANPTNPELTVQLGERLLALRRDLVQRFGRSRSHLEKLAQALSWQADCLLVAETLTESRTLYAEAVSLRFSLMECFGSDAGSLLALGTAMVASAQFHFYVGEENRAAQLAWEAWQFIQRVQPEQLDGRVTYRILPDTMMELAALLMECSPRRQVEAENLLFRMIQVADQSAASEPDESGVIRANARLGACAVFYRAGDISAAIRVAEEAYRLLSISAAQQHERSRLLLTEVEWKLEKLWAEAGDEHQARKLPRKASTRGLPLVA